MSGMVHDASLADDEQEVLRLHPHWKTLIRPLLVAIAVVAILALMLWLAVPLLKWRTTIYELTTRRLRVRSGIVTRHGRDIPLARINDVSFEKGLLDRLLGSGRLVVESAGEHGQILLNEIPHVEYVHSTLFRLVEDEQRRLERQQRSQP